MRIHRTSLAQVLLIAGLTLPAAAADGNFLLSGALQLPYGDTSYMTGAPVGFGIEGAYRLAPAGWDGMKVQFHVGQVRFYGDSGKVGWRNDDEAVMEQKYQYGMVGNHYGVDVIWPVKVFGQDISVFTGPDIHHWLVRKVNGPAGEPQGQNDNGPRAGWRLGVGYQITQKLEVTLAFTATEWRTKTSDVLLYEQGANPSRPSYGTLAVNWHF